MITELLPCGFILLVLMWSYINKNFDRVDTRFEAQAKEMNSRFDKVDVNLISLNEKVLDVDRRLCRLEGGFCL